MASCRHHHGVSDEHRAGSRYESIDSVQARGRASAQSIRLDEASRWVVVLDHMVAGAAGGDHKTAAVVDTDDQLDDSEPNRCNRTVYKDDELTRNALS